jgi:hypothetical protein
MAGTLAGGLQAAKTNKQVYGEDFYSRVGKLGGSAFHLTPRGFAANKDLARIAGRYGGSVGTRHRSKIQVSETERQKHKQRFIENYERLLKVNREARMKVNV